MRPGFVAALIFCAIVFGGGLVGFAAYRFEVGAARSELQRQMPLWHHLWLYLVFLAAAAATAGVTTRMWLRGVREASLRREHEATKEYVAALETAEAEREALIASLTKALEDVKTLRGIVPICASCKRVRDDKGYWSQVEAYVSRHTEAQFSHGVCPECAARLYPDYAERLPSDVE